MPPPAIHDLCRWHCRAGDALFGDSRRLYDPRQTGVLDTSLIHAHEQMHVDLMTTPSLDTFCAACANLRLCRSH